MTHGCATDALAAAPLATTRFAVYYLDACSGLTAPLEAMVAAIFAPERRPLLPPRLALGFTLTRADPSGRSLGDREMSVLRAIARGGRAHGYGAPQHVLDEPERWGVDPSTRKEEGGTLTTWVACERECGSL